jgi:hypothetical protein
MRDPLVLAATLERMAALHANCMWSSYMQDAVVMIRQLAQQQKAPAALDDDLAALME